MSAYPTITVNSYDFVLSKRLSKTELTDLVKELERQRDNSKDLIVDSRSLQAIPDGNQGIKLAIPEYGDYSLTSAKDCALQNSSLTKIFNTKGAFPLANWQESIS
jgi:hypothetical protein